MGQRCSPDYAVHEWINQCPERYTDDLGMLLKVLNLAQVERVAPGHPSVITYNAEENRHMLAVNEAVGFVPIGYEGVWKREFA